MGKINIKATMQEALKKRSSFCPFLKDKNIAATSRISGIIPISKDMPSAGPGSDTPYPHGECMSWERLGNISKVSEREGE